MLDTVRNEEPYPIKNLTHDTQNQEDQSEAEEELDIEEAAGGKSTEEEPEPQTESIKEVKLPDRSLERPRE